MSQMSRRFNEDGFWEHVDEVLAENEEAMLRVRPKRPGEIGGVVTKLSFQTDAELQPLPEPPEAA